ncbi:hypothetical protein IGJ51_000340 [Enterococcus sp. DIV0802c]|uniref:WxL domain-containing protein n=1 Tax=Enterococcus sp. DIV0802c TaxID=2774743 RepID=UPI003F23A30A
MKRISILASSAILLGSFFISGNVYAADSTQTADPESASTPVTADLTTPQQMTPKPPANPDNPNDIGNKSNDVTGEHGNLGIAYYPISFSFKGTLGNPELVLKDSGTNTLTDEATYNIGVKDNTRQNNSWTLTAQLQWSNSELPGSEITVTNPDQGKVKLNQNDGTSNFQTNDLVPQSDVQGTDTVQVVISNSPTTIMTKDKATVGKGTYDYSLGSVGSLKLTIPNATDLVAKQYGGNVNWNLQITPDTSSSGVD